MRDTPRTNSRGRGNTRPGARARCHRWCFTLNNPTEEETQAVRASLGKLDRCMWIFGQEVGDTGTPHLQGYLEFLNARSFAIVAAMLPRAHLEKARGNKQENIKYCKKDGKWEGNFPKSRLELILDSYSTIVWKPWQQEIIDLAGSPRQSRVINWYWEPTGHVGKTWLAKYLVLRFKCILASGKRADIYHSLAKWMELHPEDEPELIVMDIPRTNLDYVSYEALEKLKDGLVFSGKYETAQIVLGNPGPHVLVFANEPPKEEKMSEDRWMVTLVSSRPTG